MSILLITVLLLNAVGYYGFFMGWQLSYERKITSYLDADVFAPDLTMTIKYPASIPYMPDQTEFTRAYGKFEHAGQVYRIVKQRYAFDTLTIVCVRDLQYEQFNKLLSEFVTSQSSSEKSDYPASTSSRTFIKDYIIAPFSIHPIARGWQMNVKLVTTPLSLIPSFTASINHPPERLS